MYENQKTIIPDLNCHENEDKFSNDYVLRNDHRNKTTQPIQIITVSFSSEANFYLMKSKSAIFSYIKVTRIDRSDFGTPGIAVKLFHILF